MNKPFIISVLCLLLALSLMVWGFRTPAVIERASLRYYALMTEDIGTDVMQFKQGAQAAAEELGGVVITFMTCGRARPVAEELREMVRSVAALSPDGIILPSGGASTVKDAQEAGAPVICLFNAAEFNAASVITDFAALGADLAGHAVKNAGAPSYAAFLGVSEDEALMLEGIRKALSAPLEVIVASPDEASAAAAALPEDSVVFALNGELTAVLANDMRFEIWGMDPGEIRVELLRRGAVRGLAMQMPYAAGYQAVMAIASGAEGIVYSPARVVTADKMYLSENVKLMFPLLQ